MSGEILAKQNRYIRRLRDADAYSADRAVSLADIRMRSSFVWRGLLRRGVVVDAGNGRYFLDREQTEVFLERRRQIVLWMAVIAILVMIIGLLVLRVAEASQEPAPVIDVHLHAMPADALGSPPIALCVSNPSGCSRPAPSSAGSRLSNRPRFSVPSRNVTSCTRTPRVSSGWTE
jgi:hypothetical protein